VPGERGGLGISKAGGNNERAEKDENWRTWMPIASSFLLALREVVDSQGTKIELIEE
jgi:hypothetical protein